MGDVALRDEAKPLTKEEYEAWVVDASRTQAKIKAALNRGRQAMWELAEQLHTFDGQSGWKAIGYDTLGEWLADPDITMQRRTYYRMVAAWQEMVVIRHVDVPTLAQLDLSKVDIALPALRRGEAMVEDVISDVEVLGARDLRVKYQHEDEPEFVPDEDVVLEPDESELVPLEQIEVDEYRTVPWAALHTFALVGEAILRGPGRPERKAMPKELIEQLIYAVSMAHEYGAGNV